MLSNGILDIEDTEGEEISLTAEAPQLTEEERLRIESEDKEDDEKRIDLFASEDGEADPLNNLLLGEDGITTLFQAKDGGSPQLVKKSKDGKRPGYRGPGGYQSGQSDPASDQGETSSDSGFSGGNTGSSNNNNNNNNNNNDNQGSDQGHSRFDVGSGYYGETVTPSSDGGDNKDPIIDMVNKKIVVDPTTGGNIVVDRNAVLMKEKKLKMSKGKRPAAWVDPKMKEYYDNLDKYIAENTGLVSAYNIEKTLTNYLIDQIPIIGPFIPTQYPSRNINFKKISKYEVPGSDLGFYDPDEYPEMWGKGPDETEDNDSILNLIAASTETIEDRDETDIFDLWDRIKEGQAKRAMLVEKDIIQDNEPLPITKESVSSQLLNNGGLANLFRVKTQ